MTNTQDPDLSTASRLDRNRGAVMAAPTNRVRALSCSTQLPEHASTQNSYMMLYAMASQSQVARTRRAHPSRSLCCDKSQLDCWSHASGAHAHGCVLQQSFSCSIMCMIMHDSLLKAHGSSAQEWCNGLGSRHS